MSYAHVIIDANKDWKETLVLVEFGKPTSQGQEHFLILINIFQLI